VVYTLKDKSHTDKILIVNDDRLQSFGQFVDHGHILEALG
jgi:hypothetical protein